jgi:hypothetical protein
LYKDQTCKGYDLRALSSDWILGRKSLNLSWIAQCYRNYPDRAKFFNPYFQSLSGSSTLQMQIKEGREEESIRAQWQKGIQAFKEIRKKYLLYPDFD